jgi:hypothetical protein
MISWEDENMPIAQSAERTTQILKEPRLIFHAISFRAKNSQINTLGV